MQINNLDMRIAIVTDAWCPQVNGVVTTLSKTSETLNTLGHHVHIVNPQEFRSFPCPSYPEIRLAWRPYAKVRNQLDSFSPDRIHIATEGSLGLAARKYCLRNKFQFTTSYHTQFPQYVRKRFPIPLAASYHYLRWFHGAGTQTMVATLQQERDLLENGFKRIVRWSRGVDADLFRPGDPGFLLEHRPVWIYVGRIAVEKSLERYLELNLPGTKLVIGDGPARPSLEARFPAARFLGYKFGAELQAYLGAADVFVFPSRTDTFGIVILEAMACGLPIAAFPVTGPIDIVRHGITGILSEDLEFAARGALLLDKQSCRKEALRYSWTNAMRQFLDNLVPIRMTA